MLSFVYSIIDFYVIIKTASFILKKKSCLDDKLFDDSASEDYSCFIL